MLDNFRTKLRAFYYGTGPFSQSFRILTFFFEISLIVFFISATFLPHEGWVLAVELVIGIILLSDFLIRWWMSGAGFAFFKRLSTWADLLVLATLVLPLFAENLLFLRAIRAVRLFRSYHILQDLRGQYAFVTRNREAIEASLNLLVFIFIMSALVYILEVNRHPEITNFIDALYFTVSTLTTTGFGDITFSDTGGRLLSIFIMIVGVSLFLRLIQTVFRPTKVRHECPDCGLLRHEYDAVHCKHCGKLLHIGTEGVG